MVEFFSSAGWKLYVEFFKPRIAQAYLSILGIQGEQQLGALQGGLEQLLDLLVRAEDMVGGEFISQTGEADMPAESEPVSGPTDWEA